MVILSLLVVDLDKVNQDCKGGILTGSRGVLLISESHIDQSLDVLLLANHIEELLSLEHVN